MLFCAALGLALAAGCGDKDNNKTDGSTKTDGRVKADGPIAGDGTVKSDGTGPSAKGKVCIPTCTADTDCPSKGATGFTYTCSGGICYQNWCSATTDCKVAIFPSCVESGFAKQCMPKSCNSAACGSGEDCEVIFPGYKGCVPTGIPVSCKANTDCVPPDFSPGQTQCQDGYCGCVSDQACQTAKTGAGLDGTWKCLSWSGTWKEL
jgi:hypothetical protein